LESARTSETLPLHRITTRRYNPEQTTTAVKASESLHTRKTLLLLLLLLCESKVTIWLVVLLVKQKGVLIDN
jgi:hypothetical protein